MLNFTLSIIGSIGLLLGLVSMVTPIPGGFFVIAGSVTLLICSSSRAQSCLKYFRSHASWLNKIFFWLEQKIGTRISVVGNALKRTQPDEIDESLISDGR